MKKKSLFLLPCIAAVALAMYVGTKALRSNASESNSLLIANVEALSLGGDAGDDIPVEVRGQKEQYNCYFPILVPPTNCPNIKGSGPQYKCLPGCMIEQRQYKESNKKGVYRKKTILYSEFKNGGYVRWKTGDDKCSGTLSAYCPTNSEVHSKENPNYRGY